MGVVMRLTVKQLQLDMQEQFEKMSAQTKHDTHDRYELHERADHILLNLERFKQNTDFEFREVRAEITELRAEMRSEFADVRAEMRTGFAEVRAEMKEIRTAIYQLAALLTEYCDKTDMRLNRLEQHCFPPAIDFSKT
jgi:ribosomal protein L29